MFVLTLNNPTNTDPAYRGDVVLEVLRQPGFTAFYSDNVQNGIDGQAVSLWATEAQANAYGSFVISNGDAESYTVASLEAAGLTEADFVPPSEIIPAGMNQV